MTIDNLFFDRFTLDIDEDGTMEAIQFHNDDDGTRLKIVGFINAVVVKPVSRDSCNVILFLDNSLIFKFKMDYSESYRFVDEINLIQGEE